ncbi:hypothetical protein HDU93_004931, partial [Gonapodya sp. JEL0774]
AVQAVGAFGTQGQGMGNQGESGESLPHLTPSHSMSSVISYPSSTTGTGTNTSTPSSTPSSTPPSTPTRAPGQIASGVGVGVSSSASPSASPAPSPSQAPARSPSMTSTGAPSTVAVARPTRTASLVGMLKKPFARSESSSSVASLGGGGGAGGKSAGGGGGGGGVGIVGFGRRSPTQAQMGQQQQVQQQQVQHQGQHQEYQPVVQHQQVQVPMHQTQHNMQYQPTIVQQRHHEGHNVASGMHHVHQQHQQMHQQDPVAAAALTGMYPKYPEAQQQQLGAPESGRFAEQIQPPVPSVPVPVDPMGSTAERAPAPTTTEPPITLAAEAVPAGELERASSPTPTPRTIEKQRSDAATVAVTSGAAAKPVAGIRSPTPTSPSTTISAVPPHVASAVPASLTSVPARTSSRRLAAKYMGARAGTGAAVGVQPAVALDQVKPNVLEKRPESLLKAAQEQGQTQGQSQSAGGTPPAVVEESSNADWLGSWGGQKAGESVAPSLSLSLSSTPSTGTERTTPVSTRASDPRRRSATNITLKSVSDPSRTAPPAAEPPAPATTTLPSTAPSLQPKRSAANLLAASLSVASEALVTSPPPPTAPPGAIPFEDPTQQQYQPSHRSTSKRLASQILAASVGETPMSPVEQTSPVLSPTTNSPSRRAADVLAASVGGDPGGAGPTPPKRQARVGSLMRSDGKSMSDGRPVSTASSGTDRSVMSHGAADHGTVASHDSAPEPPARTVPSLDRGSRNRRPIETRLVSVGGPSEPLSPMAETSRASATGSVGPSGRPPPPSMPVGISGGVTELSSAPPSPILRSPSFDNSMLPPSSPIGGHSTRLSADFGSPRRQSFDSPPSPTNRQGQPMEITASGQVRLKRTVLPGAATASPPPQTSSTDLSAPGNRRSRVLDDSTALNRRSRVLDDSTASKRLSRSMEEVNVVNSGSLPRAPLRRPPPPELPSAEHHTDGLAPQNGLEMRAALPLSPTPSRRPPPPPLPENVSAAFDDYGSEEEIPSPPRPQQMIAGAMPVSTPPPMVESLRTLDPPPLVVPPKWAPGTLAHGARVAGQMQSQQLAQSGVPMQYQQQQYSPGMHPPAGYPPQSPVPGSMRAGSVAGSYDAYQNPGAHGYPPIQVHQYYEDPRLQQWQNGRNAAPSPLGGYDSAWESASARYTPSRASSPTGSETGSMDPRNGPVKWGKSRHQFSSLPGEMHGVSSQKQSYRRVQTMLGMSSVGPSPSPVPSVLERPNSAMGYKSRASPVPGYQAGTPQPPNLQPGRMHSRAESYTEGTTVSAAQLAPPPIDVPQPAVPAYNAIPPPGTVQSVALPPQRNRSLNRRGKGAAPIPDVQGPPPSISVSQQNGNVPTVVAPPPRISSRHATFNNAMQQLQKGSADDGANLFLPNPSRGFFGAATGQGSGSEPEDDGFGPPLERRAGSSSGSSDKDDSSVRGVQVVLVKDMEAVVDTRSEITYEEAERALAWAKATADDEEKFEVLEFLLDHLGMLPPPPWDNPDRAVYLGHEVVSMMRKLAYKKYNPRAQYTMGNLYVSGLPENCRKKDKNGVPEEWKPQYGRANDLWLMAGKRNHADAIYNSALCSERGLGTPKSGSRALQLYRKAAAMNHPGAMTRLAQALLNGDLGAVKAPRDAVKWLNLAVSYANDRFPNACVELARCHSDGIKNVVIRDESYAFGLLLKGADLGDPEAHFRLGRCFESGHLSNTIRQDLAVHHYALAAAKGHAEAALEMSGLYLAGYPSAHPEDTVPTVEPSRRKKPDDQSSSDSDSDTEAAPLAPRTSSLAANIGGNRSQFSSADVNGDIHLPAKPASFHLPQSDALALQYAVLAAEQGLPRGMFALGYFYDNGIGVREDVEAAVAWYKEAAERGDAEALARLRDMGRGDWKWAKLADKKEKEARKAQKRLAKQAAKQNGTF